MDSFLKNIIKFLQRIRIRLHDRFVMFETQYPGFLCTVVDKSSFLFMYDEIFDKEIYKFKTESADPFIIDCGSNIGLSVIYFKKLIPHAEVLALEPDPKIFKILEKNIAAAGASDGTTCVQACLAAQGGDVSFYPDGADGGSSVNHGQETKDIKVPAVVLSDYITKPVDFLKIDIEGAELEVLESSRESLKKVKNIFVEYHSQASQPQGLDSILSIFKEAGFRYYVEHIGIRSEFPYLSRNSDHGMDLQLNIYGYRA